MTKHLRFLMLALLTLVCMGGYSQTKSVVCTLDKEVAKCTTDNPDFKVSWVYSPDAYANVTNGVQFLAKKGQKSFTLTATMPFSVKVSSVTVNATRSSVKKGTKTLEVLIANSSIGTQTITKNTLQDFSFVPITPILSNSLVLQLESSVTEASHFIKTVTIEYEEVNSGLTATTTSFGSDYDNKNFNFVDGVLAGFTPPVATCKTEGVAGTIAYSSSDNDIVTVDNGGKLKFTNTKFGTATITATFTPNDKDKYAVSTATYTVINTHIYNSIADLKKAITSTSTTNPDELKVNLTDAVVTYVNGDNTFIQDATAGMLIYRVDGFVAGDKFTGTVDVKACKYWGLPQITGWTAAADMVKTTGADIPVKEVTLAELQDDAYESMRVKVVGVTATTAFVSRKATLKQGDVTLQIYDKVNALEITANSDYDIIGYPGINKTTRQLTVWSQSDITEHQEADKADPEIAFKETEKTVELKEGAIELSTLINNPHTLPVTYISSNDEVAEVSEGVIYMYKTGKVDITAKFAGNDTYNAAEKTLALTIEDNRADAGIHFEKDSYTADINKEDFDGAVLVNPNKLTVTYSINATDENVQIDDKTGYVMYPSGTEASYVVTAKFSGDDTYKPVTATYTLNIADPNYEVKTVTFDAKTDKGTTTNTKSDAMDKEGIYVTSTSAAFATGSDYRFYGKNTEHTFSVKTGKITKIEFIGNSESNPLTNLKLKEENGTFASTKSSASWTGNSNRVIFTTIAQARATKITVTVKVPVAKDFTLDENKEVNEIEDWENSNVTVKRTFYKDGDWNTLCLPFDVSTEEVEKAFGSDAQLRQVDEAHSKDNTVAFTTATAIKAGVPYLIKFDKLAEKADQPQEFNHTFEGVTLTKKVEYSVLADFNIIFTGSYSAFTPEDFLKEYNTCDVVASMAAANTLKKVYAGTTIKGLRAVFGLASSVQPQAVKVVIDGTTTGIGDLHVDGASVANGRVYNLNGQCVGTSLEGLKAGVYIQNGKKVIINK